MSMEVISSMEQEQTSDNIFNTTDTMAVVEEHFPGQWFYIEAVLAAIVTLYFTDIKDPASLFLDGPPSCGKGTVLNSFKGHDRSYWSDKFTPAAFVSQAANKSEDELRKIDMLPRIKDKALIVPELAPIFNARSDILKLNIATLTRIFDGEGYMTDAGTGGRRGYEGEYRFTFLGATTPPPDSFWKILGKLGNRLCFLKMVESTRSSTSFDFARALRQDLPYKEKLVLVREAVAVLLTQLEDVAPVSWDRVNDPQDVVTKIARYAERAR